MMTYLHCMFCFWHRQRDTSKGAPEWDEMTATDQLVEHLYAAHSAEWDAFLLECERRAMATMLPPTTPEPAAVLS